MMAVDGGSEAVWRSMELSLVVCVVCVLIAVDMGMLSRLFLPRVSVCLLACCRVAEVKWKHTMQHACAAVCIVWWWWMVVDGCSEVNTACGLL